MLGTSHLLRLLACLLTTMALLPWTLAQPDNTDCVMNPTQQDCASFTLDSDKVTSMLQDVCTQEPGLIACTLRTHCRVASTSAASPIPCSPFSLLSSACANDMPQLRGCRTYVALCRQNSVVRQCVNEGPVRGFPTTNILEQIVSNACERDKVEGCEQCMENKGWMLWGGCEPLAVYSRFCRQYPEDPVCSQLLEFCNSTTTMPPRTLCPPPSSEPPPPPPPPPLPPNDTIPMPVLRPYLHFSPPEYLIFPFLVPRTALQLALGVVAAFTIAFAHEGIGAVRVQCERRWMATVKRHTEPNITASPTAIGPDADSLAVGSTRIFGRRFTTTGPIEEEDGVGENGPLLGTPVASDRRVTLHKFKAFGLDLSIRGARSLFRLIYALHFVAIILLVATFNVPIITGVLLGLTIGSFLFGGYGVEAAAAGAG